MVSKWCCTIKTDSRSVSIHVLPSFRHLCQHTPVFPAQCVHKSQHAVSHEVTDDSCRSHRGVKGDTNMFKHTLFHTLIAARLVVSHVHYKAHAPLSPRTGDRHMSPDLNSQPLHVHLTPGLHVVWSGLNLVHLWGVLWEGPWSWCLSRCWRSLVLLLGRHCWNNPVSLKVEARQRCSLFILCFIRVLKHQHVLNVIWWESVSSACLKF